MSVLLVGLEPPVGEATITRLVAQDDEVRVLTQDRTVGERYRSLGAYIAVGDLDDADLVERAAQNARTMVLGDEGITGEALDALLRGGKTAGVDRWIYCSLRPSETVSAQIKEMAPEFVIFTTGKRLVLRRTSVPPQELAEAIDAADDLAGPVRLELDLTEPSAWSGLRITR